MTLLAAAVDGYLAVKNRALRKLKEEEFRRYLAVGFVGLLLFEGIFYLLNRYLPYQVSYLIAFELVTDASFFMHDNITFRHKKHYSLGKRFTIFQSQAIIYRLIQYAIFFALSPFVNIYAALLVSIVISFAYSYLVNKHLTWKIAAR